ncbi:MAG: glycoside hydrolase family 27 protein [Chitinophagaceae bacterium]|nr:MAG: glycoside hydrolase family 27 protein [Chitinophagaceae bacterium]
MKYGFTILLLFSFVLALGQHKESTPALAPPMGWNSYDCYGATVTASEVKANADYMAKYLKPYGWKYIVVDFCWYYPNAPHSRISPPQQKRLPEGGFEPMLAMDRYGRLLPVIRKFPASADGKGFKPLADYVHSLGLKFGIHIMRGIPRQAVWEKTPVLGAKGINAAMIADTKDTCQWLNAMYGLNMNKPGAQQYLNSLLQLYASWGVDFIKVDDISRPYHQKEIEGYRKAIENCGRTVVLSLSPGATPLSEAKHVVKDANLWRLADDFWDNWNALKAMFPLAAEWAPYAGPGHWPNLDMIPIGKLSIQGPVGPERYSHFTDAEKRTLMTLWCISRSPLILGGNLPDNTPEDLSLETNKEVLAVNQEGINSHQLYRKDSLIIWVSQIPDHKIWNVAFFNLNDQPQKIKIPFSALGIMKKVSIWNLWKKKEEGIFSGQFQQIIQPHDAELFRVAIL